MKKIICTLIIFMGILHAEDDSAKIVYDLTTKDLANFELRILKSVVANKAHYESNFRELGVSVVIHGGAYKFFVKNPAETEFKEDKEILSIHKDLGKRLESMSKTYGVEFLICGIGMKKHTLEAKDIYNFVKVIPNATIGLTDKQNEGYAYIPVN